MKKLTVVIMSFLCAVVMCAQGNVVLGGDMSWITKQESQGKKFRDANGNVMDGMELFASLGMQAARFRVWVNPTDKWDNTDDVLTKCKRAQALGLKIMIDFHYSDTWADPSHQTKPQDWSNYSVSQLTDAVAKHTKDVLTTLKDNGIDVQWVQVGNEITDGMLWPNGKLSTSSTTAKNCAAFVNAGYAAVKEVYADALVILHVSEGNKYDQTTWSVGTQQKNGAKWDITGVSFYPGDDWKNEEKTIVTNISKYVSLYKKPVMICETGINWNSAQALDFLTTLRQDIESLPTNECLGIFYWEPDCYPGFNYYQMGAVDNQGKPNAAITAFYKSTESAGLQSVATDCTHRGAYTLDGRKVNDNTALRPGLYIIDEQKVLVK